MRGRKLETRLGPSLVSRWDERSEVVVNGRLQKETFRTIYEFISNRLFCGGVRRYKFQKNRVSKSVARRKSCGFSVRC